MHAKAAESLYAACLTKSKESAARTIRALLGHLQTGGAQGKSSLCEKPKVYAEMPIVSQEGKECL